MQHVSAQTAKCTSLQADLCHRSPHSVSVCCAGTVKTLVNMEKKEARSGKWICHKLFSKLHNLISNFFISVYSEVVALMIDVLLNTRQVEGNKVNMCLVHLIDPLNTEHSSKRHQTKEMRKNSVLHLD